MKSKYLMIGAAVCAALFLFSGIMLCRQYADEKQSTEAFEQVAALVETESAPADTPQETEPLSELAAFSWHFITQMFHGLLLKTLYRARYSSCRTTRKRCSRINLGIRTPKKRAYG